MNTSVSLPPTYQAAETKLAISHLKVHMDGNPKRNDYLSYSFTMAQQLQDGLSEGKALPALWEQCDNQTQTDLGLTLDSDQYRKMTNFLINTWAYGHELKVLRKEARRERKAADGTIRPYFPKKYRGFTTP
jgi:hypothetical protein